LKRNEHPTRRESGRFGIAGDDGLAFIFYPQGGAQATLCFRPGFFANARAEDLLPRREIEFNESSQGQEASLSPPGWRIAVLAGSHRKLE